MNQEDEGSAGSDRHGTSPESPVQIPYDQLSEEALRGIIDDFILREGTDYGHEEIEHENKVSRVKKQLTQGFIRIIFDPESKSVTIVTHREWEKINSDRVL